MRRLLGSLLGLIMGVAVGTSASANAGVLVLGDSISAAYGIDKGAGWVALLAHKLARSCPGLSLDNASVSGETSAGGLARLPDLLARHRPAVVVIELGANDGLRGLPPTHMADNLRRMLRAVRAAGAQPVLLGMRIPPNFGQDYSRLFEKAFRDVATGEQVPWVRFFLDGVGDSPQLMQVDGLHPGVEAQPRLLDNAWTVLEPAVNSACKARARRRP